MRIKYLTGDWGRDPHDESQTYVFVTSFTLGLPPEPPTPNPGPRGGELFWARFFGAFAPKNRAAKVPPSPREGG